MDNLVAPASWLVALGFLFAGASAAAAAENESKLALQKPVAWSQFRGPNGSGLADAQGDVPVEFGSKKNVLWKTPIVAGGSSPCIWGNRIFLTTFDGETKKLEVLCLARNDGTILWQVDVQAEEIEKVHASSSPASGTIAADGERIYVYFGSRGLLCYDFNGKPIWNVDMPLPGLVNGSGPSPIVVGDVVLLSRDELTAPYLLAVNKVTGTEIWRHTYFRALGKFSSTSATPVVWNDQVILHRNGGICAIALSDGKLIWQVNTSTNGVTTPVISGNTLFVATWQPLGEDANRGKLPTFAQLREHDADKSGTIAAKEIPFRYALFSRPDASVKGGKNFPLRFIFGRIDSDGDGEITEKEWNGFTQQFRTNLKDHGLLAIELGGQGDITKTHVRVLVKKQIPEVPSPLVHQGRVYLVADGGRVNCLDAKSGKKLFLKRLPATGSYYASPIAVGDNIYLTSIQGVITVLQAGDEYRDIATNNLSERILATPAAVDGALYVRTQQYLYAFAVATQQ